MSYNQRITSNSPPAYVNEAYQGTGDYLTSVPTTTFIQHPSPPKVPTEGQGHNEGNGDDNRRYVVPGYAPNIIIPRPSEDKEVRDPEYQELDDSLGMTKERPLPDPTGKQATQQVATDTRQVATDILPTAHKDRNKRLVCILAVIIVILIAIIVALGGYGGWKLSQAADTTQCSSPLVHPQTVCACEVDTCSSACSQDTCTSCCSTAVGAAISSVAVGGPTIQAPVTSDNWVVIMKRESGYVDFISPNWQKYKDGFGNLKGEFWLGNEVTHKLTTNGSQWRLRVDMKAYSGECRYAVYDDFWIGPESKFYQMHISNYSGNAGDSMTGTEKSWHNHDGTYFSTYDADHDNINDTNCALRWLGGWWYNDCFYAKFTGMYGQEIGLAWEVWLGEETYLQYADMKISVV